MAKGRRIESESQQIYGVGYRLMEAMWHATPYAGAGGLTWLVGNFALSALDPENALELQERAWDGLFYGLGTPLTLFAAGAIMYFVGKSIYDWRVSRLPPPPKH